MKVSFDLKSNSFCEFYRNDFPNSIEPLKPINKNSKRNSKKKLKKKIKIESLDLISKISLFDPHDQKREIKDFVSQKNLSKDEQVHLTLNLLQQLKNVKIMERKDSKIDLQIENTPPKFDFYQTNLEFVIIFYLKEIKSCTCRFIESNRVCLDMDNSRVITLEFNHDVVKDYSRVEQCTFNLKISFKKVENYDLSVQITQDSCILSDSKNQEISTDSYKNQGQGPDLGQQEGSKVGLLDSKMLFPQYQVHLKGAKAFSEELWGSVCGILNPGIVKG